MRVSVHVLGTHEGHECALWFTCHHWGDQGGKAQACWTARDTRQTTSAEGWAWWTRRAAWDGPFTRVLNGQLRDLRSDVKFFSEGRPSQKHYLGRIDLVLSWRTDWRRKPHRDSWLLWLSLLSLGSKSIMFAFERSILIQLIKHFCASKGSNLSHLLAICSASGLSPLLKEPGDTQTPHTHSYHGNYLCGICHAQIIPQQEMPHFMVSLPVMILYW